jgi:hypothetical protein
VNSTSAKLSIDMTSAVAHGSELQHNINRRSFHCPHYTSSLLDQTSASIAPTQLPNISESCSPPKYPVASSSELRSIVRPPTVQALSPSRASSPRRHHYTRAKIRKTRTHSNLLPLNTPSPAMTMRRRTQARPLTPIRLAPRAPRSRASRRGEAAAH